VWRAYGGAIGKKNEIGDSTARGTLWELSYAASEAHKSHLKLIAAFSFIRPNNFDPIVTSL
jgi:hypothetical protein